MAQKIVRFNTFSSIYLYDNRTRTKELEAEVFEVSGWNARQQDSYWVKIIDKRTQKQIMLMPLTEWAAVMDLFDEAVISVTGKSLEEMFEND